MLKEKIVVVTGGAGLLGQGFCKAISQHGGFPIVADTNSQAAEQLVKEIRSQGGLAMAIALDICDELSVMQLIEKVEQDYGHIGALVNNAYPRNKHYGRRLEQIEYDDFCENTNLHLGGYFLTSKLFAQNFQKRGEGVIINMSSIYGVIAPQFSIYDETDMTMPLEYACIKAGIIQMTRYFAQYYKKDGLRCNSISPGGILANQPQQFIDKYNARCGKKGMLDFKDITGTLLFLLSSEAKAMNGQNIIVDDGFSL